MNVDHIIMGLGNPGPKYSFTRHNVGFMALDMLAQDLGQKFALSTKGLGRDINAETLETSLHGKKLLLIKPMTFMNLSGESLARLYQKFNHLREKPFTVYQDEVDLDFGKLRVKFGGGDAGHNGLKSLRAALGHGDYNRVRLGVGRPTPESGIAMRDHVLLAFSKAEEETLIKLLDRSLKVLDPLLGGNLQAAQVEASKI